MDEFDRWADEQINGGRTSPGHAGIRPVVHISPSVVDREMLEALLRALVAVEPLSGYDGSCAVCAADILAGVHTPSCPWLAAKRWVDGHADSMT